MSTEDRIERARLLYDNSVFNGDTGALASADAELDAVEADLALARGRVVHGRFLSEGTENPRELELFEVAAGLYRALGDIRGEGEALFWIGIFHQVVRHDHDTAVPFFERSYALAAQAEDKLTLSYVLRHLGTAEHAAGRLDTARTRLQESTRLRRELGLLPGVAANLVGLAYIASADGRPDDARTLIEEAAAIAEASDAHGVMRWVEEARTAFAAPSNQG